MACLITAVGTLLCMTNKSMPQILYHINSRQVQWMDQNDLEHNKIKLRYPMDVLRVPPGNNSETVSVYCQPSSTTNAPNGPQNDLEDYGVKDTPLMFTGTAESQILIQLAPQPTLCEVQIIVRQVLQMTPNDLEHHEVKSTTCMFWYCESHISIRFALELKAILRQRMTSK